MEGINLSPQPTFSEASAGTASKKTRKRLLAVSEQVEILSSP
jgi:hypothetical protein